MSISAVHLLDPQVTRKTTPVGTDVLHLVDPITGKDHWVMVQDIVSQSGGYPTWEGGPHSIGDRVTWGFKLWESLTNANSTIPSEGADWKEVSPGSVSEIANDPSLAMPGLFEDFFRATELALMAFNTGGGLGAGVGIGTFGENTTENVYGEGSLDTGASTNGGAAIAPDGSNRFFFGNGFSHECRLRCAFETLSDGTNTFRLIIGFTNDIAGATDGTQGAFFRYSHGINGGKWQCVTAVAGVETTIDSGVTAIITVYKVFKIKVNSDSTKVEFYIDDVKVAESTTNIPSGSAAKHTLGIKMHKTLGAASRKAHIDYLQYIPSRTTPR